MTDTTTATITLRKSWARVSYSDYFGQSTAAQRKYWQQVRFNSVTDERQRSAYADSREADRVAFAYANGQRDLMMTIFGYQHPLVEPLLAMCWDFSEEYAWHTYVSTSLGIGTDGYVWCWERFLRTRGFAFPTIALTPGTPGTQGV